MREKNLSYEKRCRDRVGESQKWVLSCDGFLGFREVWKKVGNKVQRPCHQPLKIY